MSTKCLAWAIEQTTGSTSRKAVLMLLADLADEQLTCYPGRKYLASRAELSEGAVSRVITQLTAAGYLRVLRRARRSGGRTSNRYLIMMYGPDTPLPEVGDWVSEFGAHDDETAGDGNGAAGAHMPGVDDQIAGQSNSDAGAHMPDRGNGDPASHSNVTETHSSKEEDSYPLGVNKDHAPPPTSTHSGDVASSAASDRTRQAQQVLRHITTGVDTLRLPTEVERGRLVERVVELLAEGWDPEQLAARLDGMGTLTTVVSVYAVLVSRLRDAGPPPPPPQWSAPALPWCGDPGCDRTTRRQLDDQDRPRFEQLGDQRRPLWCPRCSGR